MHFLDPEGWEGFWKVLELVFIKLCNFYGRLKTTLAGAALGWPKKRWLTLGERQGTKIVQMSFGQCLNTILATLRLWSVTFVRMSRSVLIYAQCAGCPDFSGRTITIALAETPVKRLPFACMMRIIKMLTCLHSTVVPRPIFGLPAISLRQSPPNLRDSWGSWSKAYEIDLSFACNDHRRRGGAGLPSDVHYY